MLKRDPAGWSRLKLRRGGVNLSLICPAGSIQSFSVIQHWFYETSEHHIQIEKNMFWSRSIICQLGVPISKFQWFFILGLNSLIDQNMTSVMFEDFPYWYDVFLLLTVVALVRFFDSKWKVTDIKLWCWSCSALQRFWAALYVISYCAAVYGRL